MPYKDLGINFFMVGEPGAPHNSRFNEVQDYRVISKTFNSTNLFEDKEFPADAISIGNLRLAGMTIKWKRPNEICKDLFKGAAPVFINNLEEPRFDIYQGHVGDCWFLCALADITLAKECWDVLVPSDNSTGFDSGAFHFRFWRKGKWLDTVVDDRIPCYVKNGVVVETVFLKVYTNEFWCALVEKAYAKLYGNYQKIDFGLPYEAMEDFSGGVTDYFNIGPGIDFKKIIKLSDARRSFMAVGTSAAPTPPDPKSIQIEQLDNEGIVSSHAYSVLSIKDVVSKTDPKQTYTLVHLRNPWGNDKEWVGKWGDRDDASWASVTEDLRTGVKNDAGVVAPNRKDGEFWMEYSDFLRKFASFQQCHWSATDRGVNTLGRTEIKPYCSFISHGDWVKGAKGNIKNKADLIKMKSYTVVLEHLDHEEDPVFEETTGSCTILVNLLYKDYNQSGIDPAIAPFGFRMLYAEGVTVKDESELNEAFFSKAKDVFTNPSWYKYGNSLMMEQHIRELTFRYEFAPGTICVVPYVDFPTTINAPSTLPYLLRIYAEGTVVCKECTLGDTTEYIPPNVAPEPEKPKNPEPVPVTPTPEPAKPDPAKPEPAKPDPATPEPAKPEPTKPEPAKPDPATPVPTKPEEPVKPTEPIKPEKPAYDPLAKAKAQFKQWAGEDGLLDSSELKKVLDGLCSNQIDFQGFSEQTIRSLLASADPNSTGKIDFEETRPLMSNIVQWINKFNAADENINGYLKNEEVNNALKSIGFNLNSYTLVQMRRKYADFWGNYSLDKFVQLVNDLNNALAAFNTVGYSTGGLAVFDLNRWLNTIFSL